jgi:hypothetical protein
MRNPALRSAALLAVAALTSCGGPILFGELEMPSVEVTLAQQTFNGTNISPPPSFTPFSFDIGTNVPVVNEPNVDYDLRLTQMTLVFRTGTPSNFDGLDSLSITALTPPSNPSLAPLVLLSYDNPHAATGVTVITAQSQTNADLKPYLEAGQLNVRVDYAGTALPTANWTADVTADFFLRVRLDYGAYL